MRFLTGEQRHARQAVIELPLTRKDAGLHRAQGHCLRTADSPGRRPSFGSAMAWTLLVDRHSDGSASLWACATTPRPADS